MATRRSANGPADPAGERARLEDADAERAALVLVTAPDLDTARRLARAIVVGSFAACVNLVPGVESIYRWQGAVEEASEVLLVIKTVRARLEALERELLALHPYDVAEFVVLDPSHLAPKYRAWLAAETAPRRA